MADDQSSSGLQKRKRQHHNPKDERNPQKPKLETADSGAPGQAASAADDNKSRADQRDRAKKHKWGSKAPGFGSQKHKKGDLGRNEWQRDRTDRRSQNEEQAKKRQRALDQGKEPQLPAPFSAEEIAAEERRPKNKVAVMIGYSGTGYRGLQINYQEKTIEGDLFKAFVEAKAISKANANDPKKSQLVRCARTDKGVHAAGNVLSLKLITEDPDIVAKINSHLSPQIRVWGIIRTVNSFSAYQVCDSRQYEYLIPTHVFIPPHPACWLAKKIEEYAGTANDREGYESRQAESKGFWESVEKERIRPILDGIPDKFRTKIIEALYTTDYITTHLEYTDAERERAQEQTTREDFTTTEDRKEFDGYLKALRNAYRAAKREYRLPAERLARIQPMLDQFLGTKNFHNYTIEKTFRDPSAKRHIKSFVVNQTPIVIDGTEWLSVKIWGQSFMMHQIRKMMGMLALLIRCGTPTERINESFGDVDMAIPKAPSLGLLLERPIFDTYNENQASKFGRDPVSFVPFEKEMDEFKQREIYERMYREENEENAFHAYLAHVDNWRIESFLWVTSLGLEAVAKERASRVTEGKPTNLPPIDDAESDRDVEMNG